MTRRMPPPGFEPRSIHDIIRPWAYDYRKSWYMAILRDLKAMIRDPENYERQCNWVCVIGETGFYPEAYGTVWDFNNRVNGVIQPMDMDSQVQPGLNAEYFMQEMGDHPDQEVLWMLFYGATMKADLEYQIVLNPHLVSLKHGAKAIFDEMVKLETRGWYKFFYNCVDNPATMPERTTSRGAVPRPNEPDRPRPTSHGGMPDDVVEVYDECGKQAISINTASKLPNVDGSQKFGKEIKPMHEDVMIGLSVLMHIAEPLDEHIYFFTDDASNFFNQMILARADRWQNVTVMYDYRQDMMVLVAEYCMSFGLSPASGIAQRLAILITDLVKKKFDEEEEEMVISSTNKPLREWWHTRQKLSTLTGFNEARLYLLEMYTDDPIGAIVGSDRYVRFLECWTRETKRMRLLMAIAMKRQGGVTVKWTGAKYYSIGVILIPKDKRMKAVHDLRRLVNYELNCGELRSLNGLLEFIMVVVMLGRNKMAGLYEPFQAGREAEKSQSPCHGCQR